MSITKILSGQSQSNAINNQASQANAGSHECSTGQQEALGTIADEMQ